ncbi:extracellular matrix protein fras1 [Plakobranchus ocellatus]|uniref:Extracellular matrix protein fras1 n=1 Tax=Plakobranchus ocellatus TaxID=259542 RepID=A0AAV4CM35_9GAST|nr:extracellular matrix protein fras1 [Plakobranchus ocellatus]
MSAMDEECEGRPSLEDGETWDVDPCTVCQCERGKVTCYHQTCPTCPKDTARDSQNADGQCCAPCLPVRCGPDCSSCIPSRPDYCTGCTDKGRQLQDGQCVTQCRDGMFSGRDHVCQACDSRCRTCFDQYEGSCLTCPPSLLLQAGQCVRQCGPGYFRKGETCSECHVTCNTCSGYRQDQCLTCSVAGQVMTRGRCVDSCGPDFYRQRDTCVECPAYCARCQPDSDQCVACPLGQFLHKGQCVQACPRGWFSVGRSGLCQACHPSCVQCDSLRAENCTVCQHGGPTPEGRCDNRHRCDIGQYLTEDLLCADCDTGCSRCQADPSDLRDPGITHDRDDASDPIDLHNPRSTLCFECLESGHVPFGARCYRGECPPGSYLRGTVCYGELYTRYRNNKRFHDSLEEPKSIFKRTNKHFKKRSQIPSIRR